MNKKMYQARAQIFKALGHPSRLMIVDALQTGPKTVGELVDGVGAEYATVSRHLSVLKQAGIITEDHKPKNQVFYRLQIRCLAGFFSCVTEVLQQKKSALDASL